MYNCWNEAIEYLIKISGKKIITSGFHYQGGKNTTKMVRTYDSSNVKEEDQVIIILLGQYNYGIQAKKDLYNELESRGVKLN